MFNNIIHCFLNVNLKEVSKYWKMVCHLQWMYPIWHILNLKRSAAIFKTTASVSCCHQSLKFLWYEECFANCIIREEYALYEKEKSVNYYAIDSRRI